jgi:hypothetical protein
MFSLLFSMSYCHFFHFLQEKQKYAVQYTQIPIRIEEGALIAKVNLGDKSHPSFLYYPNKEFHKSRRWIG